MYALLSDYTNLVKSCTGIYGKVFLLLIVFASQSFYAEGVLVFATELQIGFFLVLILGFITVLIKLISQKRQKNE